MNKNRIYKKHKKNTPKNINFMKVIDALLGPSEKEKKDNNKNDIYVRKD